MAERPRLQVQVDDRGMAKVEYSALIELLSNGEGTLKLPYSVLAAFLRELGGQTVAR